MSREEPEDDPMDDSTHWVGNLPETPTDSAECPTKRHTRGSQQPDIQRQKLPVEKAGDA